MIYGAEDFWRFQPHPEVWVLLSGLWLLYEYAARALGPKVVAAGEEPVTKSQRRWFLLGITLLWAAADWPVHDIAEEYLYSVHMLQHMVLAFFVPPIMLLATPEWLARLVIGDGPIGRTFLKLARPIPAAVVFNVIQLATHWSGVVNASVENGLLHYALHTVVVVTALAVWMPVVSPLPEYRVSVPSQCIHLFLTSIVPTVPAAWLTLAEGAVYSSYDHPARLWGVSVTSDQQVAGLIMKLGGGFFLWTVIVILFFRWVGTQDRGTRARRVVVGRDGAVTVDGMATGEASTADGDAASGHELTYEAVTEAFARTAPPGQPPDRG